MTYTAEQLREESDQRKAEGQHYLALIFSGYADTLEENARLSAAVAERDGHIRQMVEKAAANSLDGYRELGARCAAAELRAERAEAELAKLRQHAEAMERYKAFVDWMSLYGATISVVADERGSLRLDWYRGTVFGGSMDELMQALDDKIAAYRADFPEEK